MEPPRLVVEQLKRLGIGVLEEGGCEVNMALVREYPPNVRDVLEGIARETGYNPIVHFHVRYGDRDICIGGPPIEGRALVVRTNVPDVERAVAWAAILYHRLGVPVTHMARHLLNDACARYEDLLQDYGIPCEVPRPLPPPPVPEEGAGEEEGAVEEGVEEEEEVGRPVREPRVYVERDDLRELVTVARSLDPLVVRSMADVAHTLTRPKVLRLVQYAADTPDDVLDFVLSLMDYGTALARPKVRRLVQYAVEAPDDVIERAIEVLLQ